MKKQRRVRQGKGKRIDVVAGGRTGNYREVKATTVSTRNSTTSTRRPTRAGCWVCSRFGRGRETILLKSAEYKNAATRCWASAGTAFVVCHPAQHDLLPVLSRRSDRERSGGFGGLAAYPGDLPHRRLRGSPPVGNRTHQTECHRAQLTLVDTCGSAEYFDCTGSRFQEYS